MRVLWATWIGFALLAGQNQSADLKGTVTQVTFKVPQVHFTVVAQDDKKAWECWAGTKDNPGTPDKMEAAGWNKDRILERYTKGAVIEIHGSGAKGGPITVETLTLTKNQTKLPEPGYSGDAVAVVCEPGQSMK
jgi:hypothetical protein